MSVRAAWVLPFPGSGPDSLIFIKAYPTVEKRAEVFNGSEKHVPVPFESVLYDATLEELGLRQPEKKYVEARDTCEKEFQKPVFELRIPGGSLWPVVIIQKFGLLFCCLPLVEQGCEPKPSLIEMQGVSVGLSLLNAMADFVGTLPRDFTTTHPKLVQLYSFMCQAAPFGTLIDDNPVTIKEALQNKHCMQPVSQSKQPAWRPLMHKGKAMLNFTITEQARAVLYNSSNLQDVCEVYGMISCKADLEGTTPEVSVTLTVPQDSPPVDNLIVHPCVHGGETRLLQSGTPETGIGVGTAGASLRRRTLRLMPPREVFLLASYTASPAASAPPPITASYQMRGTEREVSLTVRLKLSARLRNAFDYFEVQLPFFNRGVIVDVDATPSVGSTVLPGDRRRLGWNLGTRLPSKSQEASLQARLQFAEYDPQRSAGSSEDAFCVGLNAYATIYFKVLDYTYTGCQIDPKSLQIHPNAKPKLSLGREFISAEYKVWNSYGDAQAVHPGPKYLQR